VAAEEKEARRCRVAEARMERRERRRGAMGES